MTQSNREIERSYVDFEARWSPFPLDGGRRVCELPREIEPSNLKQVGRFLQETYKDKDFYITDYHTYRQKTFRAQNGEEPKREKIDISETFYLYKGYPVSSSVLRRYADGKNQEAEKIRQEELEEYRKKNRTLVGRIVDCLKFPNSSLIMIKLRVAKNFR